MGSASHGTQSPQCCSDSSTMTNVEALRAEGRWSRTAPPKKKWLLSYYVESRGSNKPLYLVARRRDYSALGESSLCRVLDVKDVAERVGRAEAERALRHLKGSLSPFPDAAFQMDCEGCHGKRSIFFFSSHFTHTHAHTHPIENSVLE